MFGGTLILLLIMNMLNNSGKGAEQVGACFNVNLRCGKMEAALGGIFHLHVSSS